MFGIIIEVIIVFYLSGKIREFYFYCLLTWDEVKRKNEYILWKKHRLPYLTKKMRGEYGQIEEGWELPIDKDNNDVWAIAERLARSNHMRKDWSRFGPREESQYDF